MIFLRVLLLIFLASPVLCSVSFTPNWEKISGTTLPDITFIDANGRSVRLSDYNDKTLILHPMFTHCPSTCLFVSSRLTSAMKGLSENDQRNLRILSFSFDSAETSQSLKKFAKTFRVNSYNWKVVRAESTMIEKMLKALDFRTMQLNGANFEHANLVFVVGKDRVLLDYVFGSEINSERLRKAIRSSQGEYSSVVMLKSYIYLLAGIGLLISAFIAVQQFTKNKSGPKARPS